MLLKTLCKGLNNMNKLESTLLLSFLVLMLFTGYKVLSDLNSVDIKGQVKSIVMYQNGAKQ